MKEEKTPKEETKKKEERHAILLSGFARDYKKTLAKFKKNLRTAENVDLFICFWDYTGTRDKKKHASIKKKSGTPLIVCKDRSAGKIDKDKVAKDYQPTALRVFDLDYTTDIIEPLSRIIEDTDVCPNGLKFSYQVTRGSLMFFLIKQTFLLMKSHEDKHNIRYKNVVRARTDFVCGGHYPKVDWSRDYDDSILVGDWNWSGVNDYKINDHFAISSRKNMKSYCMFYDHMHVATKKFITNELKTTARGNTKAWSPEHMLAIYFKENKISFKRYKAGDK